MKQHLPPLAEPVSAATGENPESTASAQDLAELFVQFASAERHVLWVMDLLPKERVHYVSPAFEAVWGRSTESLYADPHVWVDAVHPDDRAAVGDAFERWATQPGVHGFDMEYRIVRPDGGVRWIHNCGQAPAAAGRQFGRRTGIAEDITAAKLSRDALLAERQRLAAIAAVAPGVLCTLRRTADGHISFPYGAKRVEALYGLPAGTMEADASGLFAKIHPDDAAAVAAAVEVSARDMTPWHAEFRVRDADGSERWIEGNSSPVLEADGAIVWHGALADISERKRTERELLRSQRRLAAVVSKMSEGLLVYNSAGLLSEWNPAALAMHELDHETTRGLSLDNALRLFTVSTLDGTVLPPERWPHARLMAGEVLRQLELRVQRLDLGWSKVFSYSGTRVDDAQGKPLFSVLQFSDVTERRHKDEEIVRLNSELEQRVAERTAELQAAVKEIEAFSYSVSHDLRAPLRALDGFSQALIEDHGALLPEDGRRYLGIIRDTAQKMGHLIDDLLAFSHLGRQSLTRRQVDCKQLVQHAFDSLALQRRGRKIELRLGSLPDCEADLALLRQVWINLIGNAVKYTRQRSEAVIEVGSSTNAGVTEYFVRDNGAGFDMQYAHKLFGVFERLHRADEFEGTGVGLAIVQRIVQRHGGQARALGAVDRGATFFFTLG